MRRNTLLLTTLILSAAVLLLAKSPAQAQSVDPANDFLPTYVGPQNGDVDVLFANVVFDGTNFRLSARMNGAIGTTTGALYVWGFDRGLGTVRFPTLADQVVFDSVITLRPDTTATVNRIVGGTSTNFGAGTVTINGAFLSALIPASELPTQGLAPGNYTWNLWPRVGAGNNNQISDFAPNNANVRVQVAPEPGSAPLAGAAILLGALIGGAGALTRRPR